MNNYLLEADLFWSGPFTWYGLETKKVLTLQTHTSNLESKSRLLSVLRQPSHGRYP